MTVKAMENSLYSKGFEKVDEWQGELCVVYTFIKDSELVRIQEDDVFYGCGKRIFISRDKGDLSEPRIVLVDSDKVSADVFNGIMSA